MLFLISKHSAVADRVAHLKRHPLPNGPPLRDDPDVIHRLALFGEALAAGEDEDVDAVLEGVELVGGQHLQEGDALPKDRKKLAFF